MIYPRDYTGTDGGLLTKPLRGYRIWELTTYEEIRRDKQLGYFYDIIASPPLPIRRTGNHLYVRSLNRVEWMDATLTATCHKGIFGVSGSHEESSPLKSCTCGIYACHSPTHGDFQELISPESFSPNSLIVAGVVEGYGRTIVGSQGFRCEKMQIVALAPIREAVTGAYDIRIMQAAPTWAGDRIRVYVEFLTIPGPERHRLDFLISSRRYQNMYLTGLEDMAHEAVEKWQQQRRTEFNLAGQLQHYGVPVFKDVASMVAQYPPIPVDNLLPKPQAGPSKADLKRLEAGILGLAPNTDT